MEIQLKLNKYEIEYPLTILIDIEIERIKKWKKGLHGNRTRDLSHPKRESYH